MRVINSKYKEFYDFYGAIIDPEGHHDDPVVYDAWGRVKLDDSTILSYATGELGKPRRVFSPERDGYPFVIEFGRVQYFMRALDVLRTGDQAVEYSGKFEVEDVRRENRKAFPAPVAIGSYDVEWRFHDRYRYLTKHKRIPLSDRKFDEFRFGSSCRWRPFEIGHPVFSGTGLAKLFDARDVYVALDQYLSSLRNDVSVDIRMTDRERAETKGFVHPTSFRNMG